MRVIAHVYLVQGLARALGYLHGQHTHICIYIYSAACTYRSFGFNLKVGKYLTNGLSFLFYFLLPPPTRAFSYRHTFCNMITIIRKIYCLRRRIALTSCLKIVKKRKITIRILFVFRQKNYTHKSLRFVCTPRISSPVGGIHIACTINYSLLSSLLLLLLLIYVYIIVYADLLAYT